jgi:hypothetical protein
MSEFGDKNKMTLKSYCDIIYFTNETFMD